MKLKTPTHPEVQYVGQDFESTWKMFADADFGDESGDAFLESIAAFDRGEKVWIAEGTWVQADNDK